MGDPKGFIKYDKELAQVEDPEVRVRHFKEFYRPMSDEKKSKQAARCMDCGIPFCHSGCPLGNLIPDFNDAVYHEDWKRAYELLIQTNNFPEFTGRICPAPCESACVLGINDNPVSIELIEKSIIEKAFDEGWVYPNAPIPNVNKRIAIIGSGPAGLACADQLNKAGYSVVVFERADRVGGLLRYGIPDFKLEKNIIDRRLEIMKAAGVQFEVNTNVGEDVTVEELKENFDAVVLCGGSTKGRDLMIKGRTANGIYQSMEFLSQNNKIVAGDEIDFSEYIDVKDQDVIVIGGGDTGSDCIGTSNRLGARSITQLEILPKPLSKRTNADPWPNWPMTLRTSSSHLEGCNRDWSVLTKCFHQDEQGNLTGIEIVKVQWKKEEDGKYTMQEMKGSNQVLPCQKVFLAIGFLGPVQNGLLSQLGVEFDDSQNVMTHNYRTSISKFYAAGDMRRGQSLVVWAIAEGREVAHVVDADLNKGISILPSKERSILAV